MHQLAILKIHKLIKNPKKIINEIGWGLIDIPIPAASAATGLPIDQAARVTNMANKVTYKVEKSIQKAAIKTAKELASKEAINFYKKAGSEAIGVVGGAIGDVTGTSALLNPITKSFQRDALAGNFKDTQKLVKNPKKIMNEIGWGLIDIPIPGANSLAKGTINSAMHGNTKYAKQAVKQLPKNMIRDAAIMGTAALMKAAI